MISTAYSDHLASLPPTLSTPYSLPLPHPDPSSTLSPPRPPLTPEQQISLDKLMNHFNKEGFELPQSVKAWKALNAGGAGGGGGGGGGGIFGSWGRGHVQLTEEESKLTPLNEVEKCYWSSEAFLRCLRSQKWNYEAGLRRCEETVVWRREFKVEEMTQEQVSREGETGKELVCGYDIYKRPVLYMHPYRQNTATGPAQIEFVVWCLERCLDLCPPTEPYATDMLCLLIDFGATKEGGKSQPTSVGQAKKVLDILQTYYCERLGRAICIDVPGLFFTFYKLVGPFVDPVTKDKIRFLEKPDASGLIPKGQLQKLAGGEIDFQYDHDTFFPALTKLAMERKANNLFRWRQYGGNKCGLSEAIIRGAVVPGDGETGSSATSTVVGGEGVEKPLIVAEEEGKGEEFKDAPLASEEKVEKAVEGLKEGVANVSLGVRVEA